MSEKKIQVKMNSGKIYGPYSREEVLKFIRKKKLRGDEEIFVLGERSWKQLSSETEFYDELQKIIVGLPEELEATKKSSSDHITAVDKRAEELNSSDGKTERQASADPNFSVDELQGESPLPIDEPSGPAILNKTKKGFREFIPKEKTSAALTTKTKSKSRTLLLILIVLIIGFLALPKKKQHIENASNFTLTSKSNYFSVLKAALSKVKNITISIPEKVKQGEDFEYSYDLSLPALFSQTLPLLEKSEKILASGTWQRIAWNLEFSAGTLDVADAAQGERLHLLAAEILAKLKKKTLLDPKFEALFDAASQIGRGQWTLATKSLAIASSSYSYASWLMEEVKFMEALEKSGTTEGFVDSGKEFNDPLARATSELRKFSFAKDPKTIGSAKNLIELNAKSFPAWVSISMYQWKNKANSVSQAQEFFLSLLSVASLYPASYQATAWKLYGEFISLFSGGELREKAISNFNLIAAKNIVGSNKEASFWDLGSKDLDVERILTFAMKRLEKNPGSVIDLALLENLGSFHGKSWLPKIQVIYNALFNRDWEKASSLVEEILAIDPSSVDALGAKIWVEASRFHFDEAFDIYDHLASFPNGQNESLKYHGLILVYGREYEKGLNDLKQYISKYPNDALAHYLSALAYYETEKNHECVKSSNLARIHGRGPVLFRSQLLFFRCRILAKLAIDEAKEELRRMYEGDPENPLLAYEYINGLFAAEEEDAAFAAAGAAVKRMPTSYQLKNLIGDLYVQKERYDEALLMYSEAKKTKPKSTETSIKIAQIFEKLEKYNEAGRNYEAAAALDPDYPELFLFGARAYRKARANQKAAELYEEEIERRPDVLNTFLEAAEFLLEINRPSDVPKLFSRFKEQYQNDPRVLTRLAQAYLGLQDVDNARKSAELAKRLDPKIPESYRVLGRIYDQQGQYEVAREHFEQYLLLMPLAGDADAVRAKLNNPPYK